ncbi:MAG: hypothetical protein LBK76_09845 [Verrucomicrobiales bacterium]|jgi:hypothetical protein|nr:hypothetical protein [Verrucomicrobiales bacterium]
MRRTLFLEHDRHGRHWLKAALVALAVAVSALTLLLTGCTTTRTASVTPTSNNLARLTTLPDAEQARDVAPIFTRDALNTVNDLETEIKELKAK